MPQQVSYDFEWNSVKALANLHKHGVSFDQAATVFLDALALTVFDETHSALEERWFTLGHDANGALLAVAHTYQVTGPASARIRIISARRATQRERRYYQDEHR